MYIRTKSKMVFIIGMIFFISMIFVAYYSINWISQETMNISLTATHLAQAGFSCIFGACVAVAFRIIIFKDKKSDWSETMKKSKGFLKDILHKYGYHYALIFITIGIFLIIISEMIKGDFNIISDNYSTLLLTSGFGFITIGIALISIKIAIDSDFKINNISNANFLSVLSRFEDRRLDLQGVSPYGRRYIHPNIIIWKALVDSKEMKELLEFCDIKEKHQLNFITLQCLLINIINQGYHIYLKCEGVKHLLQICDIVLNLDYLFNDRRTELFNDKIRILFDEPVGTTINEEYIDFMIDSTDFFSQELFILRRDQIIEWYHQP